MKKKILIIVGIVLGVLLIGIGITYGIHLKKENNKVYSIITIDVNPSMKISLNKKNKVLKVEALNEDAKVIKEGDLKGKEIDKALDIVVEKLEEKIKDNAILINVESEDKELKNKVESEVKEVLEEKKIESEVIVQSIEVTEEIKRVAEENNISESKASYVLEQIKDVEGIEIKDVVEKDISEVKEVVEERKEEIKKEAEEKEKEEAAKKEAEEKAKKEAEKKAQQSSQTTTKPSTQQSSQPTQQSSSGGCNPPAKASENIDAWCTFNKKKSQNCDFNYPEQLSLNQFTAKGLQYLGINQWDAIGSYASIQWGDSRSSYCFSGIAIITTREKRTTLTFDSVTGNVIDVKSVAVPTPKITADDAVQVLLDKYGLNKEDCKMCNANFSVNGDGGDNFYYRYDTGILMNDGTQHLADINPSTGAIIKSIY